MRTGLIVVLIPLLGGCFVDLLASTAIQSELQAESLQAMKGQLEHAQGMKSEVELQGTINAYYAEKGEYPPSLEALVPEWLPGGVPTKPDGTPYGYDPQTGRLLDAPMSPAAVAARSDNQKMAEIRAAINQFGQATGRYPWNLAELTPTYLKEVPKTASGAEFLYDMRDGGVYHPNPAELQQTGPSPGVPNPVQPRGGPPVGGGGLMGEAITGMGVQQELNNMSGAGASAAGSRMRQQSRGAGQDRNNQIDGQMEKLGL
ncbi:MAG: hypothetical protein JXR94_04440 [Candidatus Hydrogenedentes bacterium]|nr:hypothetical protein [Candidatus Hydrogenedentota bacterium]